MNFENKILVLGASGMVGSSIVRKLLNLGYTKILKPSHSELDLTNFISSEKYFKENEPDIVFFAAGRVGGIQANIKYPVEFLCDNFLLAQNVLKCSLKFHVKKVVMIGSSCMYPANSAQPMKEEFILSDKPEPTNEAFALAKISSMKLSQYYFRQYGLNVLNVIPCNLYGTNDHFEPENSHVISALIYKFTKAVEKGEQSVTLWGTGVARREFLHVDDFAEAVFFIYDKWESPDFINIGNGTDISIKELAVLIASETCFKGEIIWDSEKPDGMLRKCLEVSKLNKLGFSPKISIQEGIKRTIHEFLQSKNRS